MCRAADIYVPLREKLLHTTRTLEETQVSGWDGTGWERVGV